MLNLEKVKQPEPWKMISKPTIDRGLVSPQKKKIVVLAFLLSLIFGYFLSILKEKKSGLIFDLKELKHKINCTYLETIYSDEIQLSNKIIRLIIITTIFFLTLNQSEENQRA